MAAQVPAEIYKLPLKRQPAKSKLQGFPRSASYNGQVSSSKVQKVAEADFPTRWGQFRILGFEAEFGEGQQRRREDAVALTMGNLAAQPPLVRIHSSALPGMCSARCAAIAASSWR